MLHHIEAYTPSPINMNCNIYVEEIGDALNEPTTSLVEIADFLLDEWDNAY